MLVVNLLCRSLISHTISQFNSLNLLVLNAGISAHFNFRDLQHEGIFEKLIKTNFLVNVWLTKYALSHLKKSKGTIVVVSSLSGKFGLPQRSAYCASKFALNGFFETLRIEEPSIKIIMVYPTSLNTPMRSNNLIQIQANQKEQKREDATKCAERILLALQTGEQDVYFPKKGKLGVVLMPLFPNFMRKKIKQAAKI